MARVKSSCAIYVVFGGRKVKIPVNPEEIEIKYPTDHKTYDVIGLGEIVVPRRPSLREVSWESFFPGRPVGAVCKHWSWKTGRISGKFQNGHGGETGMPSGHFGIRCL